ncbi:MAG: glycosyltransferase [Balneola sp.]
MKKVKIISTQYPYPANKGGKIVTSSVIEILSNFFEVEIIAFSEDEEIKSKNSFIIKKWIVTKNNLFKALFSLIINLALGRSFKVYKYKSSRMNKYINELEGILIFDQLPSTINANLKQLENSLVIHHNDESQTIKLKRERKLVRRYQNYIEKTCKLNIYISKDEYNVSLQENRFYLPFHVSKFNKNKPIITNNKILNIGFIGSYSWKPNRDAVKWFCNDIFDSNSNLKLNLYGHNVEKIKDLERKNVNLVGFISNITEFYKRNDLIILPFKNSVGVKIKAIEALSYGKPILGTEEAFKGIGNFNNLDKIIFLDKDDFNEKIKIMNKDLTAYTKISRQIFSELNSEFINQSKKFAEILEHEY